MIDVAGLPLEIQLALTRAVQLSETVTPEFLEGVLARCQKQPPARRSNVAQFQQAMLLAGVLLTRAIIADRATLPPREGN